MTEEFLHYLWRFQAFSPGPWQGTEGEEIEIIDPGYPNSNSGPDFELARIRIDGQLWLGQVELHIRSMLWYQHQHQFDLAYANVILHVVYEENGKVHHPNGSLIPCLELKGRFDEQQFWRFEQQLNSHKGLPCGYSFPDASFINKEQMLQRCGIERQELRVANQLQALEHLKGDWQSLLFHKVAESLAGPVNKEAMLLLVGRVPRSLWVKYKHRPYDLQALFLGMSGLLLEANSEELEQLKKAFDFIRHKHQLEPLAPQCWKYARMRPYSFPDRRIAQLALLSPLLQTWFQEVVQGTWKPIDWPQLESLWKRHYRLRETTKRDLGLGFSEVLKNQIIINALVPLLFVYAHKLGKHDLKEKSLAFLESLAPEQNHITRVYEQLGLSMRSSFDSQAAIQWYKNYCRPKKCLTCTLGNELLKQDSNGTIT